MLAIGVTLAQAANVQPGSLGPHILRRDRSAQISAGCDVEAL